MHYYMYTRVSYRILSWGREKHGGSRMIVLCVSVLAYMYMY